MQLKQSWSLPTKPKPIVIIGAGGIVNDAHLPAYKKAGLSVAGLFDIDAQRSKKLAKSWKIPTIYSSIEEATYFTDVVYDLAIPPSEIHNVLTYIPNESAVLIQKPMGENFDQAQAILNICRTKNLTAAINFQLRFSPQMLAVTDAIKKDIIGELVEIEVHLNTKTPWHLFPFLQTMDRVEIAVHSIHYLDLIRTLAGNPNYVFAQTINDPRVPDLSQTRTTAILDYGDRLRCVLSLNHNHQSGKKFQDCYFKFEGTKGEIVAKIGVNLNYPEGEPDELWIATKGKSWKSINLQGTWFPDAFIGPMSNLQRFITHEDEQLLTSVEDSIATMALVEACYQASSNSGTSLPNW